MTYFAEVDENDKVLRTIVAEQPFIGSGVVGDSTRWIKTDKKVGTGYTYHKVLRAFVPPKPYSSWVLDKVSLKWKAPKNKPSSDSNKVYEWDEDKQNWKRIQCVDCI